MSLDGGNYGHAEAVGYLSGPLKEGVLFGKIAGYGLTEDGYARNAFDGSRGRLQVAGRRARAVARNAFRPAGSDSGLDVNRIDNEPYGAEVTTGAFGNVPGDYTIDQFYKSWEHIDYSGAALSVNYSLAGGHSLTSITAFRKSEWKTLTDETYNGFDHAWAVIRTEQRLRVPGAAVLLALGREARYVVGLYYSHQKSDTHTPVFIGDGLADLFGIPHGLQSFDERADVTTDGYAAFANATYQLADQMGRDGGRALHVRAEEPELPAVRSERAGVRANIGPLTDDYSNGEFTPTASVMYALNPHWNLYATYSSGYKSGGFNVDTLSTVENIGFDAEHVDNFEVGAKATLWEGRAQANLALFYMEYKDLQVTQYDPDTFSNFIGNAASATVSGRRARPARAGDCKTST